LLQSQFTFLEQSTHFALAEEPFDLASILLRLNKGVDLVEGSN
jgi:hypothetical protein